MLTQPPDGRDSAVLYEVVDRHVAVLTLNRPQARNAVNVPMVEAISRRVRQVEDDPQIRVAILASADPRVFCAGADLKEIAAGRGMMLAPAAGGFAGFVYAARAKPWIAATEGATLGGGLELALACDLLVASEAASFGLPEVQRGLFAGAGGVFRLPRRLPRTVALELIVTGTRLDARRALGFGLVNRVTAPGEALGAALELARSIAANSPVAVRESLAIARIGDDLPEPELRRISDEASSRVMTSADAAEGAQAFAEKRPPVWTGR